MKKTFALISVFSLLLLFGSCVPTTKQPQMTQLQIRQMQTKEYDATRKVVMEASLGFLQDEGYIIKNADGNLGIIHGTKEIDVESGWDAFFGALSGKDATWDKNSVHEISINVRDFGQTSKVRVISQVKTYNTKGGVSKIEQVTEEQFYKNIFSKIDKGVFLQKEGL